MTSKADFSEDEWKLLREAPTSAGMLVIESDRGGSIRESFSMAKAYTDARREHGASQLLDDIVSEKPEVDRTRAGSKEELRSNLLQHVRDSVTLLGEKATPEELDEYRRFLMTVANRVADARREGFMGMSGERVSDAERQAIAEVGEAAGVADGS
jgi:alkylhydroperoxidase/carboxymuconolactone decarboxylase family protein YurZ